MIYIVDINDKRYEVEVEEGKANLIKTTENVAPIAVNKEIVEVSQTSQIPSAVASNTLGEGEPIVAPIPGSIVDIKVRVGAKIEKGQLLLVMEAMKMENELYAPSAGVVSQILVSKGAIVSTNDILMTIK